MIVFAFWNVVRRPQKKTNLSWDENRDRHQGEGVTSVSASQPAATYDSGDDYIMGMITRWRWWCRWCHPSATCQPAPTFSYHLSLHHTFSPKPTKYENLQVINIASRKIILYSPLHLQPPSFHWLSSVLYICHVLLSSGAYLQSWSTSSITFKMFWIHKYLSNIIVIQGNFALLPLSAPPGALGGHPYIT